MAISLTSFLDFFFSILKSLPIELARSKEQLPQVTLQLIWLKETAKLLFAGFTVIGSLASCATVQLKENTYSHRSIFHKRFHIFITRQYFQKFCKA